MIKGSIPQELGRLSQLRILRLNDNNLTGKIPPLLGNLSKGNYLPILEHLFLDSNRITGKIPVSLSNASKITHLFFTVNDVQGNIPNEFGKLHELVWFEFEYNRISDNYLNGHLPYDLGTWLPNLQEIFLSHNQFSGDLPAAICNASKLENLEVANNSFTGPIPMMLGNLVDLIALNLQNNLLENNPGATQLDFLNSLVTSRNLVYLILASNPLNGIFTESIGNLSSNIRVLDALDCGIRGSMPTNIGNLSGLIFLGLASNNIVGNVPPSFVGLQNLERLYLSRNKLEGTFPAELCSIGRLGLLHLGENRLSGEVPSCIGNLTELRVMSIAANNFSSKLPSSFWRLVKLDSLNLSRNLLHGFFPSDVGSLQYLVSLDMSRNALQGPIPDTFSNLIVLEALDLSTNALSGVIPKSLELLRDLKYLNVSFNNLQGEVPKKGVFANVNYRFLMGNPRLCGAPDLYIPICPAQGRKTTRKKSIILRTAVPVAVTFLILVAFKTLGTIGYIAPEYGLDGQISTSSDVYSFGILLLETFTRKKPTDDLFSGDLSLHKWTSLSFPDAVLDILDADLASDIGFTIDENQSQIKQLLVLIINVAFLCLKELPEERINMREVVVQLNKIRAELTKLLTQSHSKFEKED
ncbi:hypothetical protein MTR67_008193 [Solanum verrucosum]|uniref:Protein kinase domain-containing protein n=1 Tax=Solanum verrucosum TaxID=315347 RepID=A0AAF0Q1M9_SOLVR|nr:hypothetical protein MTR67_008193 [Solanum verrucosum]